MRALAGCLGLSRCLMVVLIAALGWAGARGEAQQWVVTGAEVESLRVEVVSVRPHDPEAFTQGLLLHEGKLYESTGLYGRSSLRRVDPQTGEVEQQINLPAQYFGEGLALVDGKLIQLTWREQRAFVYDLETFEQIGEFVYTGQGWGLCYDGENLIMTNGSSTMTFRDPATFEQLGDVTVTLSGSPLNRLNELQYLDGFVYANVFTTDEIVKINARTGRVAAVIDASGLLTPEERAEADVLNGIAYDPHTETFLITGKLWPKLFEVKFVEKEEEAE